MAKTPAKEKAFYDPNTNPTPKQEVDGMWITREAPHQVVRIWRHSHERPPIAEEPPEVVGYCARAANKNFSFTPSDQVECVYTPVAEEATPTRLGTATREELVTILTGREPQSDDKIPPKVVSIDNMGLLSSHRREGIIDGAETAYVMVQRLRRLYSGDKTRGDYEPLFQDVDSAFREGNLRELREALQRLVNGIR